LEAETINPSFMLELRINSRDKINSVEDIQTCQNQFYTLHYIETNSKLNC